MKILIACEESQRVTVEMRRLGHEAYSCDVQKPSGGHPEWHIHGDAIKVLSSKSIQTMDGEIHAIGKWDMLIAHPPCTYLSSAGAVRLFDADHKIKDKAREQKMFEAASFFKKFWEADCSRIAIENPAPMHHAGLPAYSQIIQPYMFGDPWKKRTCLWLKGLPPLAATNIVKPLACWVNAGRAGNGRSTCRVKLQKEGYMGKKSAKDRSKTFPGIACAMAEQWAGEAAQAEEE